MRCHARLRNGFTLIELMVTVAIGALLVTLVAPSMSDLIATQRVQSVNAELVTDLQWARSEAVRQTNSVVVKFGSTAANTCYTVYIDSVSGNCDCARGAGAACTSDKYELRTVAVARSTGVTVTTAAIPPRIDFSARNGMTSQAGVVAANVVSTRRGQLRTAVAPSGRPQVCTPDGSIKSFPPC